MKLSARFPAIFLTSVVAGVFSLIVGLLLIVDFAARGSYELFDSPQYVALQKELAEEGPSPERREAIRQLDLQLRAVYFRKRQFTRIGVMLLLGGVIVTLVTARWAASLHAALPHPAPFNTEVDQEAVQQRWGRWAAGIAIGALAILLSFIALRTPQILPPEPTVSRQASRTIPGDDKSPGPSAGKGSGTPRTQASAPPLPSAVVYLAQWPRFRGPTGSGVSALTDIPDKWSVASGEGLLWKTKVPLPGFNSPVVWEDHVFLSGATAKKQAVFCFSLSTGKQLWRYDVPPISPRPDEFEVNEETGYAASTTATDGLRIYAIFASCDIAALDFKGRRIWQKGLGVPDNPYGHATSLATYKGRVIVQIDQAAAKDGKSKLMALDGRTGDTVWEIARKVPSSWASPIVVEHEQQATIVTCANPWVIAYAAEDGKELWRAKCLEADVGPSPVYSNGEVVVANESGGMAVIRAGGTGDVTDSHIAWKTDIDVPDICSPLATDKFILLFSHGLLACFDRKGGEEPLWEEDFEEEASASPGLVGDHLYLFSTEGKAWIVKPTAEKCERVAECDMGEPCFTSPAFVPGRMVIRTKNHLLCIGQEKQEKQ